jgi:hypothetical protein
MNYPFELSEDDTKQSIKNDFDLLTTFTDDDDKEYNISWETNSNAVTISDDGHVTVNSVNSNRSVELTAVYKTFFAKSEITYDCIIETDEEQVYSTDDIIDIASVENNTCETNIQIAKREDNSIAYIYGDFGSVVVYNEKDAVSLVDLYKDTLGIDSNITLNSYSTFSTNDITQYTISASYNDIVITDNYVLVCVDNITFKPIKIVNEVTENITDTMSSDVEINSEDYYDILISYLGTDEFAYSDEGTCIVDNKYYEKVTIYFSYYSTATAYIDKNTLEVVSMTDDSSYSAINITESRAEISGTDEFNSTINTIGSLSVSFGGYTLIDPDRNIEIMRSIESSDFTFKGLITSKQFTDVSLCGIGACEWIVSGTSEFDKEDAVEVETLYALQQAYDFYNNTFGIVSYDGKGSKISAATNISDVYILGLNMGDKYKVGNLNTNAAWNQVSERMYIGITNTFVNSMASDPTVLGHEYTHAIYNNSKADLAVSGGKYSTAISEAYADVMSALIFNNFVMGSNKIKADYKIDGEEIGKDTDIAIRDLTVLKQSEIVEALFGKTYEYYDEEGFDDADGHQQAILIGHLAYEMYNSGYWTKDEEAQVWMQSLMLGIDTDSFVSVRRNLIQAADSLGYNKECQDFIAYQCDLMHIFDDSYEITTDKYIDSETGESDDNLIIIGSTDNSIPGDVLLDNEVGHRYLVFYSPTGLYFNGDKIYIYQEGSNNTGLTDEEISKLIENKLNTSSNLKDCIEAANELKDATSEIISILTNGESNLDSVKTNDYISVEYKHIPSWGMNLCEKLLTDGEMSMREYAYKAAGVTEEQLDSDTKKWFNFLTWLAMDYYVINTTAYDLYNNL